VEHAVNSKFAFRMEEGLESSADCCVLLEVLKDELETAMRLCGISDLRDADPSFFNTAELDYLVPRGPRHPYARKHPKPGRLVKSGRYQ